MNRNISSHQWPQTAIAVIFLFLLFLLSASSVAEAMDYTTYQKFLDTYLVQGKQINGFSLNVVDYEAIFISKDNPSSLYKKVLDEFKEFSSGSLKTRKNRIAFWINAYNIGAIKIIIDHYPVDSIRSRDIQFFKNPWGKPVLDIGGRKYSLGEIEHDILLGELKEPLAHFAIVCASLSCPELSRKAYSGDTLTEHLDKQAVNFLRDTKKGIRIDREEKKIFFSKIFKFDKKTFLDGAASAISLISPHLKEEDRQYLANEKYKIRYLDYNWALNTLSQAK